MTVLETFLEDPQEILETVSKGLGAIAGFQELLTILRRGKLMCDYSIESLMSRPEFTDMEMYDALECMNNPFAEVWYNNFNLRRYFRSTSGYLGIGLHQIQPGDGIYLIKGASVP
jgi:hypothetical protein